MKSFLEEYGTTILVSIVVVVLLISLTPISNSVRNSIVNLVSKFEEYSGAQIPGDFYEIKYDLGNGTLYSIKEEYNTKSETFRIGEPVNGEKEFLGWSGSNNATDFLDVYSKNNPLVATARDTFPLGKTRTIPVKKGEKYRMFITAKQVYGTLPITVAFGFSQYDPEIDWYYCYGCTKTKAYEDLGDGWIRYYKDFTIPDGVYEAFVFIQMEIVSGVPPQKYLVYDIEVVKTDNGNLNNPKVEKGSAEDKVYKAHWKSLE